MIASDITVGTGSQKILTPGPAMRAAYIQNTGNQNLRISFDGLTAPTPTKGVQIFPGGGLWIPFPQMNSGLYPKQLPPILACAEASTTTVAVSTDDMISTSP